MRRMAAMAWLAGLLLCLGSISQAAEPELVEDLLVRPVQEDSIDFMPPGTGGRREAVSTVRLRPGDFPPLTGSESLRADWAVQAVKAGAGFLVNHPVGTEGSAGGGSGWSKGLPNGDAIGAEREVFFLEWGLPVGLGRDQSGRLLHVPVSEHLGLTGGWMRGMDREGILQGADVAGFVLRDSYLADNLVHELVVARIRGPASRDSTPEQRCSGHGLGMVLTRVDTVWEVDFNHSYQIYEGMAAMLEVGWLRPDYSDASTVWGREASELANAWRFLLGMKFRY